MVYIPKGKNIRTRMGCICKNKYYDSDKTVLNVNTCTTQQGANPWCRTKNKCGRAGSHRKADGTPYVLYWDYCSPESLTSNVFADSPIIVDKVKGNVYGENYFLYNSIGIVLFYIIFVFAIPYFLYKNKYSELLEVYIPNFDLLATAISFAGGPTYKNIFQELYNTGSDNLMGFFSTLMIKYMALMGVVYIVAMHAKRSKSIATGLGVGAVMVFLTYLLPNEIISYIQGEVATLLRGFLDSKHDIGPTIYFVAVFIGLGIAGLFIGAEKAILARHKTFIDPITKQIVKLAKGRF